MFTKKAKDPQHRRFELLAVIMLGTLLASVGVAWLLVRRARAKTRRGAEVIAQIRQGLALHWRNHPKVQWYLVRIDDELIGWRAIARIPRKGGGYEGMNLYYQSIGPGAVIAERWTLNADASEGLYDARVLVGNAAVPNRPDTHIALSDGQVKVLHAKYGRSRAAAPTNYVPEGTRDLACFLAGRRKATAQFQMVLNDMPPEEKSRKIRFVQFTVMQSVRSGNTLRVTERLSMPPGPATERTYDSEGRLLLRRTGQEVRSAVSEEEITKAFPDAPEILQRLLKPAPKKRPPSGGVPQPPERSFRKGAVGTGYLSTG